MESNNKTDFILYWYCIKLSTVKHHKAVHSTLFYQYSINVIKQSNTKKEWIHSIDMILLCFVHLSTFYILNDLFLLKRNFLSFFMTFKTLWVWNRQKSHTSIWRPFLCVLDEWIEKISKKPFSWWLFESYKHKSRTVSKEYFTTSFNISRYLDKTLQIIPPSPRIFTPSYDPVVRHVKMNQKDWLGSHDLALSNYSN